MIVKNYYYVLLCLILILFAGISSAEVMRYKMTKPNTRLYLFVDDNKWEGANRQSVLDSQNEKVGKNIPSDPRDYLLKDRVVSGNGELQKEYAKSLEDTLMHDLLPTFSRLTTMDMGTNLSPFNLFMEVVNKAMDQLRKMADPLEKTLSLSSGPRNITFIIAPWEKLPTNNKDLARLVTENSRYTNHEMGFSSLFKTPTRDIFSKNWIYDPESGDAISYGQRGNLGARILDLAKHRSPIITTGEYDGVEYIAPPYVYPLAFIVNLKIQKGKSSVSIQGVLGLNPLYKKLSPPQNSSGAVIDNGGIPQPGPVYAGDMDTNYPLMQISFDHDIRKKLDVARFHFDFGVWDQYHPLKRRFVISNEKNYWRMTPYVGGEVIKGNTNHDWSHIKVPVRIHLSEFDIDADVKKEKIEMKNLKTKIDLFDNKSGRLFPFPSNIRIGITNGGPTTEAAKSLQTSVNKMIDDAFKKAKVTTREKALSTFPMAAIFINKK